MTTTLTHDDLNLLIDAMLRERQDTHASGDLDRCAHAGRVLTLLIEHKGEQGSETVGGVPSTPCPPWCTTSHHNGPDEQHPDGSVTVTHGARLSDDDALDIEMTQTTTTTADGQQRSGVVGVNLYADAQPEQLSPARLRALSDRLRIVADQLEAIQHQAIRDALKGSQGD